MLICGSWSPGFKTSPPHPLIHPWTAHHSPLYSFPPLSSSCTHTVAGGTAEKMLWWFLCNAVVKCKGGAGCLLGGGYRCQKVAVNLYNSSRMKSGAERENWLSWRSKWLLWLVWSSSVYKCRLLRRIWHCCASTAVQLLVRKEYFSFYFVKKRAL